MELTPDGWNDIYNEVERTAQQYFNLELKQVYKNKTSINFSVARFERRAKAFAQKDSHKNFSYNITISAGMLDLLYSLASRLIEDQKFLVLINPLKGKKKIVRDLLFFTYVDLIICHEWSHILCGHLDYQGNGKHDYLEGYESSFSREKTMELEADSRACTIILARLVITSTSIHNILYGASMPSQYGYCKPWEIITYAILSLFDYFENSYDNTTNTHPKPSIRAFTSTIFIIGELVDNPYMRGNLPFISDNMYELTEYFAKITVQFYIKYKKFTPQELSEVQDEAYEYCLNIRSIIDLFKLDDNRLFNIKKNNL